MRESFFKTGSSKNFKNKQTNLVYLIFILITLRKFQWRIYSFWTWRKTWFPGTLFYIYTELLYKQLKSLSNFN